MISASVAQDLRVKALIGISSLRSLSTSCKPAIGGITRSGGLSGKLYFGHKSETTGIPKRPGAWINMLPAPVMVFLAILSIQVGAATAKSLFSSLGVFGVVWMRTGFAALVLCLFAPPQVHRYSAWQWYQAALLGSAIGAMNIAFYAAIARLPLGIVVTIEFLGPLSVALLGSRSAADLIWPLLAFSGVLLLTPLGGLAGLDPLGLLYALGAAVGWAAYIILMARTGAIFPGTTGLALAMAVAALVTTPLGITDLDALVADASLLFKGFLVAMLSTAVPFSLEFLALKRMPPRMFGVLVSTEPAVAGLVGLVLLNEILGPRGWVALTLVSLATVGVTLYGKNRSE